MFSNVVFPEPLAPGSGQAARQPLSHVLHSMLHSWSPPWPITNHFVGLRHRLAPPEKVLTEIPNKLLDIKGSGLEKLYMNRWGTAETVSFSTSGSQDELSASSSRDEDLSPTTQGDNPHGFYAYERSFARSNGTRNLFVGYGSTDDLAS